MISLAALLIFISSAAALALPNGGTAAALALPNGGTAAALALPNGGTAASSSSSSSSPPITAPPSQTTAAIHCDLSYCEGGTSYCHYWGGITSWDRSGPLPGEVRTTLGACQGFAAEPTPA